MPKNETSHRNALIIKIALFLNYLKKDDHPKLIKKLQALQKTNKDVDVLKVLLVNKYINQADFNSLKKICIGFATVHEDSRLGSLCINFGFLTQSNLDLALEEQKRLAEAGKNIMLGDLLVDAGMISERQRNLLLQKQKFEGLAKRGTGQSAQTDSKQDAPSDNSPDYDISNMRETREAEFVLLVSNDGLTALIKKTEQFDNAMLLADLKFLLEKNGIIYGLADDDSLETFIKDPKYKDTLFEVARGLEPIDGTDAQIIYMFERDYLKPGELAEDGTIDFKERGEIPFVSQGDVLAEKIPPKAGKDGVSVYGDSIAQCEASDISLSLGKGVRGSSDGLKVISVVEGNPKVSPTGEISVNDAYFIEGDVDYTTGHIKFDKNVYITGSIKSGFRVEAIDVVANTIDGGIVKAKGDVFIQNGITDSAIEAKGSIKAGFVHRSKASCLGDMTVVKEVVDTDAMLEGTFEMRKGRLFSSTICAKGGAKIYQIGSERTKPSTITVGASIYLETELKNIDKSIERRQNVLENKNLEKNKLTSQLAVIDEKLDNFDQSRKRTLAMIEEMKKKTAQAPDSASDSKIDLFQKGLDEADKKIHVLLDQKALIETQLKKIATEIKTSADAVKQSVQEKFRLKRMNQTQPPRPILDAEGIILSGTKISGRFANLVVRETLSRSRIMEMNQNQSDNPSKRGWEMIVTSL
jgi:uncharacterized protein (DUF342 family)